MLKLNTYLNRVGTLWRLAMLLLLAFASPHIYAADLYMIGNVDSYTWNPQQGIKLTETSSGSGIFYSPEKIKITGYFGFTPQLGNSDSDWDTYNSNRLYPGSDKTLALDKNIPYQTANTDYGDSWDDSLKGEYHVFVNTNTKNIRFSNSGYIPWLDLYLVGSKYGWNNTSDN